MIQKEVISDWFLELRDKICHSYEEIERNFAKQHNNRNPQKFSRQKWERAGGGGGVTAVMKGSVFEKVGVNISTVHGIFSEEFKSKIPGAAQDPRFFATGISLVAHMNSPLVPAMHFNTRYIETTKQWFAGGADLTPIYPIKSEAKKFHEAFKKVCDKYNPDYYTQFKKACDEYFFLKHRNEPRGVGGVFYDYLNTGDLENDFAFTKDIGLAIYDVYPKLVVCKMNRPWTKQQRHDQLIKRGRYVEFNLLYDRGTAFGLATGGNVEAILMSLPPEVKWT